VLNVLLLVPWGVAAGYALRRFWPVVAVGAAASLLIELTQGLLGNGTCHSDDLVRNAAGAVIGAGIGIVAAQVCGREPPPTVTGR
jgi:glycopeptide antibiotics resistance protein